MRVLEFGYTILNSQCKDDASNVNVHRSTPTMLWETKYCNIYILERFFYWTYDERKIQKRFIEGKSRLSPELIFRRWTNWISFWPLKILKKSFLISSYNRGLTCDELILNQKSPEEQSKYLQQLRIHNLKTI